MTGRANKSNVTMVETGFPGSPKIFASDASEHDRFAGLNSSAREKEFGPKVHQHVFDEVVLAHRNAAGQQKQIGAQAVFDQFPQPLWFIGGDREQDGLRAGRLDLRAERVAVGIANLIRLRLEANIHDLITGCEHSNRGTRVHLQLHFPDRRRNGDGRLGEERSL